MPRLAEFLNVGVTSLYWYFKSKDELFEAMSREAFHLFHERMIIPAEGDWDERLLAYFRRFREVLTDDPVLCDFVVVRVGHIRTGGVGRTLGNIEQMLQVLVEAGFADHVALQAYNSLSIYTRGSIFVDQSRLSHGRGLGFAAGLKGLQGDPVFEALRVMSDAVRDRDISAREEFEFGLENAVRGLRHLLSESS
jgi:AcrR family transcriptional regulator